MKYFKLEPTYKKSLVELTMFNRPLSDLRENATEGQTATLVKEIGWRWGDFLISVPETEDEIEEWVKWKNPDYPYENFFELAVDYGLTEIDGDSGEDVLPTDRTVSELIESLLLPDLDDDYILITEDYPDAEMQSCWDGCWEDWSVRTSYNAPDIDQEEFDFEEIEDAYTEEYEEGVESLGWQFADCEFEMHCKPMITQVDEDGEAIGEPRVSEDE